MTRKSLGLWLPIAFFLGFLAWKLPHLQDAIQAGKTGPDGGYYLNLALHVREGQGFKTSVSPFNQGLPYFPHPSSVYPLWPLLLGYLGRFMDIFLAAHIVPAILHALAVILAFFVGNNLFPGQRFDIIPNRITIVPGYLLAYLFAFNPLLDRFTVLPYTEGLAWCLILGLFLRLKTLITLSHPLKALELGVWLGMLMLVRAQFLVVLLAFGAFALLRLIVELLLEPRMRIEALRGFAFALSALVIAALCMTPHLLKVAQFAQDGAFWSYMRFDQMQATRHVPQLRPMVETKDAAAWIADRLQGFLISLSTTSDASYFKNFRDQTWGLVFFLIAAPILAARHLWRLGPRSTIETLLRWSRSHQAPFVFIISSAGLWLSLYTIHFKYWTIWPFGSRHGFAAVFAVFLSWLGLNAWLQASIARRALALLLAATLISSSLKILKPGPGDPTIDPDWPRLGRELISRLPSGARVLVSAEGAKKVSPWALTLGLHQLFPGSTPGDLACFQQKLGVTHLVIPIHKESAEEVLSEIGLDTAALESRGLMTRLEDGLLISLPPPSAACASQT